MMLRSIAVGAAALFALSISSASAVELTSVSNHKPPPDGGPQVQAPVGGTVVKDSGGTSHGSTSVAVDTDLAVKPNAHSNGSQGCTSAKSHSGKVASIFDRGDPGVLTSYKNASRSQPCGKGKGQMDDANSALGDVSTTR
jgi:hypothetical protein